MNIYEFIPSKDVAAYCKRIKYTFRPIEMAWLIDQSEKSIQEKNKLFQELIDDYPDMAFHKSVEFCVKTGLHDYLRALIRWNEQALSCFFCPGHKKTVFYTLADYSIGELGLGPKIDPIRDFMKKQKGYKRFQSFDELWEDVCPHWDRADNLKFIRVFMYEKDKRDKYYLCADINRAGEFFHLSNDSCNSCKSSWGTHPGELHELFVHIPVPFQPGDLVCACYEEEVPYVLRSLPLFRDVSPEKLSGAKSSYCHKRAETPDFATVYTIGQNGDLEQSFPDDIKPSDPFAQGWGIDPMELSWYRGTLDGVNQKLIDFGKQIKQRKG